MKRVITSIIISAVLLCLACGKAPAADQPSTAEAAAKSTMEATSQAASAQPTATPIAVNVPVLLATPSPTAAPEHTSDLFASASPNENTPLPEVTPEPTCTPEPEAIREDLSRQCSFTCTQKNVSSYLLTDDNLQTSIILADKISMTYTWAEKVPASMIYLFSYVMPDAYHIRQWDGAESLLSDEEVTPQRMCLQLPLREGCRKVTVTCLGRCKINAFKVFGPGNTFPERVVWWTEGNADHCDLMLISTHFDDEILMMGGVLPIYAGEQGRDCLVVYMKGTDKIRKLEAIQGLWEMGVRREAIYLSCTSNSLQKALDNDAAGVFAKDNLQKLVYLLRRYRPLVVVTHDVNGEYGHESHVKTSALVRRAVELASDPAYDPDTAAEYGAWQVQKEYIHLWPENTLELDIKSPLKNMGERTAYEVAAKAFTYHQTQQKWSIRSTNSKYPIGHFGLYFTAVGPDSGLNDMFENVQAP